MLGEGGGRWANAKKRKKSGTNERNILQTSERKFMRVLNRERKFRLKMVPSNSRLPEQWVRTGLLAEIFQNFSLLTILFSKFSISVIEFPAAFL